MKISETAAIILSLTSVIEQEVPKSLRRQYDDLLHFARGYAARLRAMATPDQQEGAPIPRQAWIGGTLREVTETDDQGTDATVFYREVRDPLDGRLVALVVVDGPGEEARNVELICQAPPFAVSLKAVARALREYTAHLNDEENTGFNARIPTGDDYNNLHDLVFRAITRP